MKIYTFTEKQRNANRVDAIKTSVYSNRKASTSDKKNNKCSIFNKTIQITFSSLDLILKWFYEMKKKDWISNQEMPACLPVGREPIPDSYRDSYYGE